MLGRIHLAAGVLGLIVFVLQGQYMDIVHDHLVGMADGPRMLYRSGHIYFLLMSVINIIVGVYYSSDAKVLPPPLQWLASAVMLLAPLALLAGFFLEPALQDLARPFTRPAVYVLFGTGIVLAIAKVFRTGR